VVAVARRAAEAAEAPASVVVVVRRAGAGNIMAKFSLHGDTTTSTRTKASLLILDARCLSELMSTCDKQPYEIAKIVFNADLPYHDQLMVLKGMALRHVTEQLKQLEQLEPSTKHDPKCTFNQLVGYCKRVLNDTAPRPVAKEDKELLSLLVTDTGMAPVRIGFCFCPFCGVNLDHVKE
jgi:hypothetical protein